MGDSTNKGESMHFPPEEREKKGKEGLRGRKKNEKGAGGGLRDEGGDATGSVTVSCTLVSSFLPSALGRSLAHNMESINPHRIPLSPQDTCPVCLPPSFFLFLLAAYRCIFGIMKI